MISPAPVVFRSLGDAEGALRARALSVAEDKADELKSQNIGPIWKRTDCKQDIEDEFPPVESLMGKCEIMR